MHDVLRSIAKSLPARRWLGQYSRNDAWKDFIAGIAVGVMLVPQGMAYAVIAGLPPIYGLYAGLIPLLIYPFIGSSRQLAVGPIALDMVIVAAGVGALATAGTPRYVALAILLTALVGLVQIGMSLARLGFIADLLSRPVIDGFAAAAAFIIAFSQLGNLLGIELRSSQYVYVLIWEAWQRLYDLHLPSLLVGVGGILVIFAVRRYKPRLPDVLVVAVGGIVLSWWLDLETYGVAVIGTIPQGLPPIAWPELSLGDVRALLPTALTLALVQFMTIVTLTRVFASKHRYSMNANHELMAIGSANLIGSFFRSPPVSGSFSRSAVNDRSGARSPLANIGAAAVVGLTLMFLTPLFYYLPLPVLASIIIVAAIGLLDFKEIQVLFRIRKREGFVALFTFAATLILGIQEGILLGVTASMLVVLYRMSRPKMAELGHLAGTRSFRDVTRIPEATPIDGVLILRVNAAFSFANAEYFKDFILQKSHRDPDAIRVVIIDGASINDMDTTAIEALDSIIDTLQEEGIELYFTGLIGMVRDLMQKSRLYQRLGPDHFHRNPHQAVRHVLSAWDAEDGGDRLDRYLAATEKPEAVTTDVFG